MDPAVVPQLLVPFRPYPLTPLPGGSPGVGRPLESHLLQHLYPLWRERRGPTVHVLAMQLPLFVDKVSQGTVPFGHVAMSILRLVLREFFDSVDEFAAQYCWIERAQEGIHCILLWGLLFCCCRLLLNLDLNFRWCGSSAEQTAATCTCTFASVGSLMKMELGTRTQSAWR